MELGSLSNLIHPSLIMLPISPILPHAHVGGHHAAHTGNEPLRVQTPHERFLTILLLLLFIFSLPCLPQGPRSSVLTRLLMAVVTLSSHCHNLKG